MCSFVYLNFSHTTAHITCADHSPCRLGQEAADTVTGGAYNCVHGFTFFPNNHSKRPHSKTLKSMQSSQYRRVMNTLICMLMPQRSHDRYVVNSSPRSGAYSSAITEHPPAGTSHGRSSRSDKCAPRSEEHTSELQSRFDLVCRLVL